MIEWDLKIKPSTIEKQKYLYVCFRNQNFVHPCFIYHSNELENYDDFRTLENRSDEMRTSLNLLKIFKTILKKKYF